MSIVENSLICRLILAFWTGLTGLWEGSWLHSRFAALGQEIRKKGEESLLCTLIWREGTLERAWPRSVSCGLLTLLLNIPCALAKWIYKAGKKWWDGSFFCRLIGGMGGAATILTGLFMLGMLIAPHEIWNNVYGLLGAVTLTALFVFASGKHPLRMEPDRVSPHVIFFFAFVAIALASSLATRLSLRFFFFHVTCFLIVLLMVSATNRVEQLRYGVAVMSGGLFLASLYGCYQGLIGVDVVASQQDMKVNVGMPGRVYSFFDNPNNFAEVLVMLLPLVLALLLTSKTLRGRLFSLLVLGTGVAAIGYTYSRSGWLGLALALFVFLALQNWKIVPFALAAGILALPFLPESIYNRFLSIGNMKDTSTRYRFAIYDATWNLMGDHWAKGVGLGSDVMKKAFTTYPTMFDGNHPIHTHNNYLQMWGELGIFGGLAYLAIVFGQLKGGLKAFYSAKNKELRTLTAGAVGGFCGIMLIGVAEYTWFYPRNMFFFWFLFGTIAACVKLAKLEK